MCIFNLSSLSGLYTQLCVIFQLVTVTCWGHCQAPRVRQMVASVSVSPGSLDGGVTSVALDTTTSQRRDVNVSPNVQNAYLTKSLATEPFH